MSVTGGTVEQLEGFGMAKPVRVKQLTNQLFEIIEELERLYLPLPPPS